MATRMNGANTSIGVRGGHGGDGEECAWQHGQGSRAAGLVDVLLRIVERHQTACW